MFVRYHNPDDVGWLGYFVDRMADGGEVVTAFVALDRRVLFVSEIKGWDRHHHSGSSKIVPPDPDVDWWDDA